MTGIPELPRTGGTPPEPPPAQPGPQPGGRQLPEPGPPPGGSGELAGLPEYPGPGPSAGGQPTDTSGGAPGGGVPAPIPLWRRGRVLLIAGIVAVLLAALGVVVQRTVTGRPGSHAPPGTLILPGTLLGLRQDTSKTRALDRSFLRHFAAGARGTGRGLVAGTYGHPPAEFVVLGGRLCRSCAFRSLDDALRGLSLSGISTLTFEPGPKGGSLLCADHSALPHAKPGTFACWWYDHTSAALVIYTAGVASSLGRAAELTRQVRAVVER